MASLSKGTVLVTGLHGFTGEYLDRLLTQAGYRVAGLVSGRPRKTDEYLVDMRDAQAVRAAVHAVQPDYAVHLAAISHVAHGDTAEIYDVNVKGTLHLTQALAAQPKPVRKLLLASSGNLYGDIGERPIDEDTPIRPQNDYGLSKQQAEDVVRQAGLPTVIARPFNYTGVGQNPAFVVPKLVAAFRSGERRLKVGDIDTVRDFSDVRWMVQAYLGLLESDFTGTVNVCSGRGTRIRDVLEALEGLAGRRVETETDPAFLRSNEIRHLVGSPARLEGLLRLPPRPALLETLEWMYRASV